MTWHAARKLLHASAASRAARLSFLFAVLAFCAAPVPGDAGGCNQRPQELDAPAFFDRKQYIDCIQCRECGVTSAACEVACGPVMDVPAFPDGCIPLVHDGEVCLRALLVASCDEYREYTRDEGATTPTECNFCPRRSP